MTDPVDPPPFAPFERTGTESVYDSPWCSLRRDVLSLPDGSRRDYHVFGVAPAAVIVPVLADGSLVMLWQYRYPHGETHWEVPAGRIDPGERPEQAAARELTEETGYRARELTRLCGFYPINGISDHYAHVFVAHGCERVCAPEHDPSEQISVHVLEREAVRARLLAGEVVDGFSALALHHYFARG